MELIHLHPQVDQELVDGLKRMLEAAESGELVGFVGVLTFNDLEGGAVKMGECILPEDYNDITNTLRILGGGALDNIPGAAGQAIFLVHQMAEFMDVEDV